jgi:trigger factor
MNVIYKNTDTLNAVIRISIEKKDYEKKVLKILNDYKKNANISGFRKGHVPLGIIKKQYEKSVISDEVNKLLREKLEGYINEEKLNILGTPLPQAIENEIDWKFNSIDFDFDIGLSPKFEIKLSSLKKVVYYQIEPDKKMVNEQMVYLRKQYGKIVSKNKINSDFEITAKFNNIESELETIATFTLEDIKNSSYVKELKSFEKNKKFEFKFKNLFTDQNKAKQILKIDNEKVKKISGNILVEIKEINERVLADLNQSLFDKLYEPGSVTSEKQLLEKIKEGLENQFKPQSEQKLLNDITEYLVGNTKFKLPESFLKRWMQTAGKEPISEKEADEEFTRSEKGIRYQLIEGQIIKENNLEANIEELKKFAKSMVTNQMLQYGQQPEEKKLDGIVSNIFSNKDETRRISDQLMSQKLINFYKEKAPLKFKKVSFDEFTKLAYGKA